MSGDSHKDKLDRGPLPNTAPTAPTARSAIPTGEPGSASPQQQRQDLLDSLAALEGQFRFMGKGHPEYASTQRRIQELKLMLERVNKLLG